MTDLSSEDDKVLDEISSLLKEQEELVKAEKEESKEEVVKPEDTPEENIENKKEESLEEETKLYTAQAGEEKINIPFDAKIDISTKSGKEAQVSLEELKSDYWGKQEVSRRLNDIDKQKKEMKEVLNFHELVKNRSDELNGYERISKILQDLQHLDENLTQDLREFVSKIYEEGAKLTTMTDEQKKLYALERENSSLKGKESLNQELEQQKELQSQIESGKARLMEDYGVSEDKLVTLVDELVKKGQLKEETSLTQAFEVIEKSLKEEITISRLNRVLDVVEKIDPKLAKNEDAMLDLYAIYERHPDMSDEELKNKAERLFGSKKLEKEATQKVKQQESVTGRKNNQDKTTKTTFENKQAKTVKSIQDDLEDAIGGSLWS